MKKEDIKPWDWYRIFFGETDMGFLGEIVLRTLVIYLFLLVTVKYLGKRMGGQLSITEMAVMVSLGAIIAPPMQIPDRGLLVGMIILLTMLFLLQSLNYLSFKRTLIEELVQGKEKTLVKDGVIDVKSMKDSRISREQLFAALRQRNIHNLGEVKRVYLEACGLFSIYKNELPEMTLSTLPPKDKDLHIETVPPLKLVCTVCGHTVKASNLYEECPHCHQKKWSVITYETTRTLPH